MNHRVDWTGERVGKLTVIGPAMRDGKQISVRNALVWDCRCDCSKATLELLLLAKDIA